MSLREFQINVFVYFGRFTCRTIPRRNDTIDVHKYWRLMPMVVTKQLIGYMAIRQKAEYQREVVRLFILHETAKIVYQQIK